MCLDFKFVVLVPLDINITYTITRPDLWLQFWGHADNNVSSAASTFISLYAVDGSRLSRPM